MNKKGFTLIELLVVTSIIMILTNIAYVGYNEVREMSRDNRRKVDIQTAANALEYYKTDTGQYYHFSDYSYSDTNFLKRLQEEGMATLLFDSKNKCPEVKLDSIYNNYLTEPLADPVNDEAHMYYYFADTYRTTDCNKLLLTVNPDSLLPKIKNIFPKLEGCLDYGECSKSKVMTYNNLFGDSCYGKDSNKAIYILAASLENRNDDIDNIKDYFDFCPVSDSNHPDYLDFKDMTYYFQSLNLNHFVILEDIIDYWETEEYKNPPKK